MINHNGEASEPSTIPSSIKQDCVIAPTFFSIFFSLLLNFVFRHSIQGIHLHTRSDGKLFNLARLRPKTKVHTILIREMLFVDDVALTSHTEGDLQQLMNQFAHTCREFGLIISIKKINVMGQDIPAPPSIIINDKVLEVTNHFTYLGLTITSNQTLDREIDKCIAKAARVCPN